MSVLRDLLDGWSQRISCPLLAFVSASIALANWDILFILFASEAPAESRVDFAKANLNVFTGLVVPTLLGTALCFLLPWLNLLFVRASANPLYKRKLSELNLTHGLRISELKNASVAEGEKQKLEAARIEKERLQEQALLERAAREKAAVELGSDAADRLQGLRDVGRTAEAFEPDFFDAVDVSLVRFLSQIAHEMPISDLTENKALAKMITPLGASPDGVRSRVLIEASINKLYSAEIVRKSSHGFSLSKLGYDVFDRFVREGR